MPPTQGSAHRKLSPTIGTAGLLLGEIWGRLTFGGPGDPDLGVPGAQTGIFGGHFAQSVVGCLQLSANNYFQIWHTNRTRREPFSCMLIGSSLKLCCAKPRRRSSCRACWRGPNLKNPRFGVKNRPKRPKNSPKRYRYTPDCWHYFHRFGHKRSARVSGVQRSRASNAAGDGACGLEVRKPPRKIAHRGPLGSGKISELKDPLLYSAARPNLYSA